jgi:cohesin loading factor subunit SCC2
MGCIVIFADGTVAGFCELLDDYLERAEIPGEDEGEEEGTWLPLSEIKILANEITSAHSRNTLHLVPVDTIVRLLSLLDRHIRRGHDMTVDEEDDVSLYNNLFSWFLFQINHMVY